MGVEWNASSCAAWVERHDPAYHDDRAVETVLLSSLLDRKLLFALLAVLAAIHVLYATSNGTAVNPDSVVYVSAARNIAAGNGVTVLSSSGVLQPLTRYPPLLPTALAALGTLGGVDALATARWLNAALFGLTVLLSMLLVWRYSEGRSAYAAILAGAVLATSPHLLQVYASVLSEPLFLFLWLAAFVLLCRSIEASSNRLLLLAALVVGLAPLARFTGVVACASGALVLLVWGHERWPERVARAAAFGVVSASPLAVWLAYLCLTAGSASDRTFLFHPPQAEHLASGVYTLRSWLVPADWLRLTREPAAQMGLAIFAGLSVAHLHWTVMELRRRPAAEARLRQVPLDYLLFTFVAVYLWFLAFSIAFFDFETDPHLRMLAPVFVAVVMLLALAAARLARSVPTPAYARAVVGILAACLSVSYLLRGAEWLGDDGLDMEFASERWQQSQTIALVRRMPPDLKIYSNGPDAIYIITGRRAIRIPAEFESTSRLQRDDYPAKLSQLDRELDAGGAVVVYFDAIGWRWYLPDQEELDESIGLVQLAETEDGVVYSGDRAVPPPRLGLVDDTLGSAVAALHTFDERRERGLSGRLE